MDEEQDTHVDQDEHPVLTAVEDKETYGSVTGNTKWFNDKLGYGFITICDGDDKGKDIFVHHTGIKPLNSNYKTLRKGEYIQFNIINGQNGLQAVDITGIKGGPLMCDYVTSKRPLNGEQIFNESFQNQYTNPMIQQPYQTVPYHHQSTPPTHSHPTHQTHPNEWQTVAPRKPRVQSYTNGKPAKNVAKYNKATRKANV